jgi:endonuclease/exonuclease/phosphatase family metal-dependent hydrolase
VDAYRARHPGEPGYTFPTWGPHVRLDYLFVPAGYLERIRSCEIVQQETVAAASDHLPLLSELDT